MNEQNQSMNTTSQYGSKILENNNKTTIRLYFPHQQGEIGLQQRATLIVNTPVTGIPTGVKVIGLDLHGEALQLCPKQKKDHDCVTKTLHEEFFAGGAKVDVTFYCKGLSSGGCKTKKPARVCISVTLTFPESMTSIMTAPFIVKGNRRQKVKRICDTSLRESLSVTTVIDHPLIIKDTAKPPGTQSNSYIIDRATPAAPSSASLLSTDFKPIDLNNMDYRPLSPDEPRIIQTHRPFNHPSFNWISRFSQTDYSTIPVSSIIPLNSPTVALNHHHQLGTYSTNDYIVPPDDYLESNQIDSQDILSHYQFHNNSKPYMESASFELPNSNSLNNGAKRRKFWKS